MVAEDIGFTGSKEPLAVLGMALEIVLEGFGAQGPLAAVASFKESVFMVERTVKGILGCIEKECPGPMKLVCIGWVSMSAWLQIGKEWVSMVDWLLAGIG